MEETLYQIILGVGGLGLFLAYVGWNRRRIDGGRYCRRCGYRVDRSGEMVERCSECGSDLTARGMVLPFQRRRNVLLVLFGLLLVSGSGLVVVTDATQRISATDLYRLLPNWFLLRTDVTETGDFGDEQVAVLRNRVQMDEWSEKQLREFTRMLCLRATNLHRRPYRNGGMAYTGMTKSLFKAHKPDDGEVDDLLMALTGMLVENSGTAAGSRDGGALRVRLPVMVCEPEYPYLQSTDVTADMMWGEVVSFELARGGEVVKLPSKELTQQGGWMAVFDLAALEDGAGALELRVEINWFIESDTAGVPVKGLGVTPWHTFELVCDLTVDPRGEMGVRYGIEARSLAEEMN